MPVHRPLASMRLHLARQPRALESEPVIQAWSARHITLPLSFTADFFPHCAVGMPLLSEVQTSDESVLGFHRNQLSPRWCRQHVFRGRTVGPGIVFSVASFVLNAASPRREGTLLATSTFGRQLPRLPPKRWAFTSTGSDSRNYDNARRPRDHPAGDAVERGEAEQGLFGGRRTGASLIVGVVATHGRVRTWMRMHAPTHVGTRQTGPRDPLHSAGLLGMLPRPCSLISAARIFTHAGTCASTCACACTSAGEHTHTYTHKHTLVFARAYPSVGGHAREDAIKLVVRPPSDARSCPRWLPLWLHDGGRQNRELGPMCPATLDNRPVRRCRPRHTSSGLLWRRRVQRCDVACGRIPEALIGHPGLPQRPGAAHRAMDRRSAQRGPLQRRTPARCRVFGHSRATGALPAHCAGRSAPSGPPPPATMRCPCQQASWQEAPDIVVVWVCDERYIELGQPLKQWSFPVNMRAFAERGVPVLCPCAHLGE